MLLAHLVVSTAVAAAFAWRFGQSGGTVASHLLLLAEWDLLIVTAVRALPAPRRRISAALLLAATFSLQAWLYAFDAIANASWGRNITGRLILAFAPTVWSGREPFPLRRTGIVAIAAATVLVMLALAWRFAAGRTFVSPARRARSVACACVAAALLVVTVRSGIEARDNRFWKEEPIAGFFRPVGYAFEPSVRREAVADRDAALRAAYPREVPGASRRNVVLVIVDSLRADHMQVYGYGRATTPFLAQLVESGRMTRIDAAFASCSESFCGITSTLSSREFRDISARTYDLQDVLHDQGYRTWFVLSGNHTAWNGLPQFYHADEGTLFDGSQTRRYTMDDDRLVLEGLERVPPAARDQPAFFYLHLMSTHYLGVEFPESHVFTPAADTIDSGAEPYSILPELEKPARYDDKVLQADGILRRVFESLAAKGYLDAAIVVVTGDHGEGLGERHWAHGWDLHNEDIRIPLLLYDTVPATYPDRSFAAQVDIAPTILDRLGLPIPASWEGQSLLAPARRRFTYHQTYFVPNRFAVLYRDDGALFKFILTPQYGKEELYDLRQDDGERRNLVGERPALAALLRDKLRAYRDDAP